MDAPARIQAYLDASRRLRVALSIPPGAPLHATVLGQGEYNANYLFRHPVTGKRLVLRVNHGSQMHLAHQIAYEYHALELLESCGRTPVPRFLDDGPQAPEGGVLIEGFIEGRELNYARDLDEAARILADVHSTPLPADHGLIAPDDTAGAIIEECDQMYAVYAGSPLFEQRVDGQVSRLHRAAERSRASIEYFHELTARSPKTRRSASDVGPHLINTEVNSTNFLIRDEVDGCADGLPAGHLIDWEKPIAGDVEQDIADFLAPTATFWKTDVILDDAVMQHFLATYSQAVDGRFALAGLEEQVAAYLPVICLRGVCWCAMALVEYADPARPLRNESTAAKISQYLADDFLGMLCERFA